ncbi:MAG: hypothetical protein B5M53_02490 [Candidatus Cloacimonas sp. 4484_209]|nr:MAG: hypothetical protein B5M53_02490 [Candidatus Cloacimonas sp. 4484_209]
MKNKHFIIPFIIATLSFIINIVYILELRKSPLFYFPQMDALYHIEWAKRILSGDIIGKEVFFRAPLYPYSLALILKISHNSFVVTRLFQAFVSSVSIFLIYHISRKFFTKKVAISSSIIATLYGPLVYFTGEFLIVPLIIFFDLSIILFLFKTIEKPTFWRWLIAGLLFGLSAIARPNILLPALLLPLFLFYYYRSKQVIKWTTGLFAGILIIVFPVLIRNYIVGKDFVPIASQAGINFYIGNNQYSDGTTAIAPGTRGTWWGGYYDAIKIAEKEMGKHLKPSEISNFWMKKGLEFIVYSPYDAFKLFVKKCFLFFSGMEFSNNKDIYFFKRYSKILNILIWRVLLKIPKSAKLPFFIFGFPFSILIPFSFAGIFFSFREKDKRKILLVFLITTYFISVVIFFVNARYRMPVIPILIMFAVYGFIKLFRAKKTQYYIIPIIVFFLFNLNLFRVSPPSAVQSLYNIGIAYGKMHKYKEALKHYQMAIEEDPSFYEVYVNIGNIYARFNYNDIAEKMYKKSLEINPKHEKAYFNLGHLALKKNNLNKAYKYYEKAFSIDPNYYLAYYYAGVAKEKLGEIGNAIAFYKKALTINENFLPAKKKLSHLLTHY